MRELWLNTNLISVYHHPGVPFQWEGPTIPTGGPCEPHSQNTPGWCVHPDSNSSKNFLLFFAFFVHESDQSIILSLGNNCNDDLEDWFLSSNDFSRIPRTLYILYNWLCLKKKVISFQIELTMGLGHLLYCIASSSSSSSSMIASNGDHRLFKWVPPVNPTFMGNHSDVSFFGFGCIQSH